MSPDNDPEMATASVITDGLAISEVRRDPDHKVLINFPPRLLLQDGAFALPKDTCIIEILETIQPEPETINAIRRLKEAGYTLALDDFTGNPAFDVLIDIVDIVKVDVLELSPTQIICIGQKYAGRSKLLAEKVETDLVHSLTRSLGFTLFQGFYFSKPIMETGRTIPTGSIMHLRLINELNAPDCDLNSLSRLISQDPGLSYRLLKYINSAAYTFNARVESISAAVILMGCEPLRHWLMVVGLTNLISHDKAQDVLSCSVIRGRFLELACEAGLIGSTKPGSMFMLGLFSSLDVILNQSMEHIVPHLALNETIEKALCGQRNQARNWLDLTLAIETGDWATVTATLRGSKIKENQLASLHARATIWAREILVSS
ncbi:EAL and HDOD domain-containing protein [Desulfovibrio inopinatus]|uniref:EAL and HDOD domain-containing protein n=1 Tax=Desulfovibrio inopinatus TaxID=102109 RepID=UPI00040AA39B|nr:HDOD domain-containing protein [Desulfovibrio inopinatus]